MFYLSEDSSNSPFVRLFNSAYDAKFLIGVGTNRALPKRARSLASDGSKVIVYLDLVPGNPCLNGLYGKLFRLYTKEKLDVVVFPVVCAEYMFIKSVIGLDGTISNFDGLQYILDRSPEYLQSSIAKQYGKEWTSTFERFCKLFCERCLNDECCSTYGDADKVFSKPYYSGGCDCTGCKTCLSLEEKAYRYLSQFPVIPSLDGMSTGLSWDEVLNLHRDVVKEYNLWAGAFEGHIDIVALPEWR